MRVARAAAPAIQSNAAMRPVAPSRRYEKKRAGSACVHRSPPPIDATPARASRAPRERGRSASHLPGAPRREARGRAPHRRATNASRTSSPTSNAAGPMRGAEPGARCAPDRTRIASTVRSSTPAARPRQPACATPMTAAVACGEQHGQAVGDAHRERRQSGARVTAASARGGRARGASTSPAIDDDVGAVHLLAASRRAAGRCARTRRRFSATARGGVVAERRARRRGSSDRVRAAADAAGARRDERAHAGRRPASRARASRAGATSARASADGDVSASSRCARCAQRVDQRREIGAAAARRHAQSAARSTGARARAASRAAPGGRTRAAAARRGACRTRDRRPADGRSRARCTRIWCVRPVSSVQRTQRRDRRSARRR